jgi:hypothetical protein
MIAVQVLDLHGVCVDAAAADILVVQFVLFKQVGQSVSANHEPSISPISASPK